MGASDSRGKPQQQQRPLSASFNMFQSKQQQQQQQQQPIGTTMGGVEGEEGERAGEGSFATEEETDEEEEEEGEEAGLGVSSSSYAGRFEEWMGACRWCIAAVVAMDVLSLSI